jgi:hypothetical protein
VRSIPEIVKLAFTPRGVDIEAAVVASRQDLVPVLRQIAAQETPSANATVKRMAKLAREAIVEVA